jgi:hypothetical protein
LRADGTFSASVPDYMMMTFDNASGRVISGKGQWSLEPPNPLAPIGINLAFSEVDGERRNCSVSNTLQAEQAKQGVELFFTSGKKEASGSFSSQRLVSQRRRGRRNNAA